MNLKESIIYGENGRKIAAYKTCDEQDFDNKKKQKWLCEILDKEKKEFFLRSPDIWIVDITDYYKANYYGNYIVNLAYFNYLKNKERQNRLKDFIWYVLGAKPKYYKDFDFELVTGFLIETEIRILGSDSRINTLKHDLFEYFCKSNEYSEYYSNAKSIIGNNIAPNNYYNNFKESFDSCSYRLFKLVEEEYRKIGESIKYNPIKINNVVEQLPEYDVLILIPKGSFKYFSTFINEDNKEKVMIWEIHANRNVTGNMKLYCKDLHNKKVLIVDNIYSGKTMKIIKDLVIQEGGHPITLGLFPKSSSAINQLDYFMVLNKVYNSKEFINEKNWYIKYYTDAIKE